jgi:uncharacterized protein (TIGR02217 family)
MAGFLDDQIFPVHISRGSSGGPDWPAEIVTLDSGREERNSRIAAPLRSYDAAYSVRTPDELYQILELYYLAMGRLYGFRMLDWTDYRSGPPHRMPAYDDQLLAVGDGTTKNFQLVKTYGSGPTAFRRPIQKPFGGIAIGLSGVPQAGGYAVDPATGILGFAAPPAPGASITWGGQFHVPVRFDCKLDQVSLRSAAIGDIPSILLKELHL